MGTAFNKTAQRHLSLGFPSSLLLSASLPRQLAAEQCCALSFDKVAAAERGP